MKRLLLTILIAVAGCAVGIAQNLIEYRMQTDGAFLDSNRDEYTIVELGDKSAKEIYDEMMMNASFLYRKPNEVLSGVDGKMISLRGGEDIKYPDKNGAEASGHVQYGIYFWIKDGRVMVKAPTLENMGYGSSKISPKELSDLYIASNDKSGLIDFEGQLEYIVNYILGIAPNGIYPYKRDW